MHQIRLRLRLRPDPAEGAYCAPPDTIAGFKGPTPTSKTKSRVEEGRGRKVVGEFASYGVDAPCRGV